MGPATRPREWGGRQVGLWATRACGLGGSSLVARSPSPRPDLCCLRPQPAAFGRAGHMGPPPRSGLGAQPLDPRESGNLGPCTSPARPLEAGSSGDCRTAPTRVPRARQERCSHAGSREASQEQGRAGGGAGRARVTQPGRPMSASPRGTPSQLETRKFVSGIKGGRERGSPGVKLKLNPVSYKEVTGGRFRLPIRNNTGFVATTEEEDSKTTSPVPKPASPSSHAPLPQFMTEKRKGSQGALCSSLPVGSREAGGVGW